MSKWSGWAALDPEHAQQILSQIDELAEIVRKDGRIDDAELTRRFPFLSVPHVDHLAAMSWVRDRAVVISCEGYGSARAAAEPEKTAAKAAAKERAAAARASAPAALVKFSPLSEHVPKTIVVAQCQLRNIKFKAGDKVDALRLLWKEFDQNVERCQALGLVPPLVSAAAADAALPVARARSPQSDFSRRVSPRRDSRADAAAAADSPAARASRVSPRRAGGGGAAAASAAAAAAAASAAAAAASAAAAAAGAASPLRAPPRVGTFSPGGRYSSWLITASPPAHGGGARAR
jgi:hypothetical protein